MKVVICWTNISGYMAACWRELSARPGIDLTILAFRPAVTAPFNEEVMAGLSYHLLDTGQRQDSQFIQRLVTDQKPDAVFIAGWGNGPYNSLLKTPALRGSRFATGMDTSRLDTLRQKVGRIWLRRHFKRFAAVIAAGERAWQFARFVGVEESKLYRGYYGLDYDAFAQASAARLKCETWPRRFLFTGRYVPVKGIQSLIQAYEIYRDKVDDPWPLTTCGAGPAAERLGAVAGVDDRGFVQPSDLPAVFAQAGAFVLPSHVEPWGVVIAEACAAGLPVICTEACGASVELVRSYHNGLTVATDDAAALMRGLCWLHQHEDPAGLGARSQAFGAAYSAVRWADRWQAMFAAMLH